MSAYKHGGSFADESLPLRQYAAELGHRSRSPSRAPDSSLNSQADAGDTIGSHNADALQASDRLLEHPTIKPQPIGSRRQTASANLQKNRIVVNQNFRKLLLPGLVRCGISWVLIAGFYLSVWLYKDRVISPRTKAGFDTITIALSIAFGLNIADALKGIALNLRWWFLSRRKRPAREVELILHCDSMSELLKLMFLAPRPWIITGCLSWLALNMLVQISIAVLSLTYSANQGIGDIFRAPGLNNVTIPNMATFAPTTGQFNDTYLAESFAAHVLGDIGSSYNFSILPNQSLTGTPLALNPAAFWNATDHWQYRFLESAPVVGPPGPSFLSLYTDNVVNSTGVCETPAYQVTMTDGLAVIQLLKKNETVTFLQPVESTYYLTTPILAQDASTGSCGPGCSNLKVLEVASGPPVPGSFVAASQYFFYDCNITVTSTTSPNFSPLRAAVAAQAIALSGQPAPKDSDAGSNQYVSYNSGLPFGEAQNNNASAMASLLSRFAIGVVAAAAQTNPSQTIQSGQPTQGLRLQLTDLVTFSTILCLAGGLQILLVVITAVIVSRLAIPEEVLMSHEEEIEKRFVSR